MAIAYHRSMAGGSASPFRKLARILIWLALPPAVLWLIAVVLFDAVATRAPAREHTWDAAGGKPVPAEFRYLMFPAHEAVPVFDKPDGTPSGVLTRALANAPQELEAGGWIEVQSPRGNGWVRRADLGFAAPSGKETEYLKAYEAAFRQHNPDASQFRTRFASSPGSSGERQVRFVRYEDDDHYTEYLYTVSSGTPTPLRLDRVFGPALVLGTAMLMPIHLAAASVVLAAGVLAIRSYRRTRSAARPPATA